MSLVEAEHPWAGIAQKHASIFRVAGIAGADIQCMPYQICEACEAPYRHDQKQNRRCSVCGKAALRDFEFEVSDGRRISRTYIERELYGNTHLVLYRAYNGYGVPPERIRESSNPEQPFPDQVVRHLANCFRDARKVGRRHFENYVAFILGWFSHVVSDALFKGVYQNAVKVSFFGHQYNMAMLPAAETLTMTDLASDFGVHWPTWHKELLKLEPDGGALTHLTMGNPSSYYDPSYWGPEFGKPDETIGRLIKAVPPINRRWFYRMYTQPDYSAASPQLDRYSFRDRTQARFGPENFDLGQLRRYAKATGWYEAFTAGVAIYTGLVNAATHLAGIRAAQIKVNRAPNTPSVALWRAVLEEADTSDADWGSRIRVEPEVPDWLRLARGRPVLIRTGRRATDYQIALARRLRQRLRPAIRLAGERLRVLIGGPAHNRETAQHLCVEDALRLKYDSGLAGIIMVQKGALLVIGFSDFGDMLLAQELERL